jgi:hypothetical protein
MVNDKGDDYNGEDYRDISNAASSKI